ncbi:hypothetical protein HaLaN_12402 [Haematococcus lacustris]|uniref:Uncharacterized protein n=1 Tax=Haematococcus lacustris TaxID=44745 RepID=A0A699ZB12_HAELA|nr:hypothetical protein HaLaN_12402 [Haematococcus lacustris]
MAVGPCPSTTWAAPSRREGNIFWAAASAPLTLAYSAAVLKIDNTKDPPFGMPIHELSKTKDKKAAESNGADGTPEPARQPSKNLCEQSTPNGAPVAAEATLPLSSRRPQLACCMMRLEQHWAATWKAHESWYERLCRQMRIMHVTRHNAVGNSLDLGSSGETCHDLGAGCQPLNCISAAHH